MCCLDTAKGKGPRPRKEKPLTGDEMLHRAHFFFTQDFNGNGLYGFRTEVAGQALQICHGIKNLSFILEAVRPQIFLHFKNRGCFLPRFLK